MDEDVRNRKLLAAALEGVEGVVHLAAVSRVVWGERDPALCRAVNVEGVRSLVELCANADSRPWLIFASSREVYGVAESLPVRETQPLRPVNVYGRSKRDGEHIVDSGRDRGVQTNICRLSNVFGCPFDHADRVVMAFARAAARGGVISVEGGTNIFDFTVVADVVDGLVRLIKATSLGATLPPIHFVSGHGITLRALAETAASLAINSVKIVDAPPRTFDVGAFVGDPSRAYEFLAWRSTSDLRSAIGKLVIDLAEEALS